MTSPENTRQPGQAGALPQPPASGQIHILLVDDDPTFRSTVQQLLKKLGYAVSVADGGRAALETAARNKDIQLLIADLIMPGMTGVELAGKLRETDPRLGVLFTSGHLGMLFTSGSPRKIIAPMGVPADSVNFLQKPFKLAEIDARIKTILAQRNEKEKGDG
jgi:CheY-like chemotaxis protein